MENVAARKSCINEKNCFSAGKEFFQFALTFLCPPVKILFDKTITHGREMRQTQISFVILAKELAIVKRPTKGGLSCGKCRGEKIMYKRKKTPCADEVYIQSS